MRRFVDDDAGYLDWLAAHPDGFVINTLRKPGPAYLVLHRANCSAIGGLPTYGRQWTAAYAKICGDRDELEAFARQGLGGEATLCGRCLDRTVTPGPHAPPAHSYPVPQPGSAPARPPQLERRSPRTAPSPAHTNIGIATRPAGPLFAPPTSDPLRLDVQPRLASWNTAGDPDQVRLQAFLAAAERVVRPRLETLADPLVLRLDVGLPPATPLLDQHDLDNYLFPLVTHLAKRTGRRFVSAWATKQTSETSWVRVEQARPVHGSPIFDRPYTVRTTASSQSSGFKQQIHDQLSAANPLPDGPVWLQLAFTVGPQRNWTNLWKPTIDALDPILGSITPGRSWHPRDGRIIELGLHCHIDAALGNDVIVTITANQPRTGSGYAQR
ncbi:hypothetical protein [Micromonospora sp. L31]|uniref:hypothetical protein n=1 Tax=Micromonospora sp. L31 TaxID=3452213 RepID=UPI003F8AA3CD